MLIINMRLHFLRSFEHLEAHGTFIAHGNASYVAFFVHSVHFIFRRWILQCAEITHRFWAHPANMFVCKYAKVTCYIQFYFFLMLSVSVHWDGFISTIYWDGFISTILISIFSLLLFYIWFIYNAIIVIRFYILIVGRFITWICFLDFLCTIKTFSDILCLSPKRLIPISLRHWGDSEVGYEDNITREIWKLSVSMLYALSPDTRT